MNKHYLSAIAAVGCTVLLTLAAITASAVEPETGSDASSAASSAVSSVASSAASSGESSSASSSSQNVSSVTSTPSSEDSTSEDTSSEQDTSSQESTSSDTSDTSSSSTSSSGTSSKKPIQSSGGHGNTFIDMPSYDSSTESTSSEAEMISSDISESVDEEEIDYFQAKVASASKGIYKIIWIPIVLSILCIGGLVTVNVLFRKKYPKKGTAPSRRRNKSHSHEAPKKRR